VRIERHRSGGRVIGALHHARVRFHTVDQAQHREIADIEFALDPA
jgi:hypothetical protein